MATSKSVWGLDIGQCALKAIKLREVDGQLEAEAFDLIEHPRVLSEPDVDREALINQSLEEFFDRNDVTNCRVAVSVPGQSSFTRFVRLPQMDPKRTPQLIRFEAEQQIPFDINEVIWRWQSFVDPDSPELSVGLFAMKRQDVYRVINPFGKFDVGVDLVQMAPLSLYNFMTYDRQVDEKGATLLVDLGANGTELVVADGPRLWTRTIQLGGNDFTEALVKSFNLSFAKAEKLKRTAATSKYARQVFQAMRPIFADLVQEIQRSIGYYTSLRREARFTRIVGVGNGFRLPGLQKFLEQNLSTPVARVDAFNALQANEVTSAAKFTENAPSYAVAYGLALQALELAEVDTNLLPDEIASIRRWKKKRPWFGAAAAVLVLAFGAMAYREISDNMVLTQPSAEFQKVQEINNKYRQLKQEYDDVRNAAASNAGDVQELLELTRYNRVWPSIQKLIFGAIADAAPHQSLLAGGQVDQLRQIQPRQRAFVVLQSMTSETIATPQSPEVAQAIIEQRAGGAAGAGFLNQDEESSSRDGLLVILNGRCPMDRNATTTLINDIMTATEAQAEIVLGDRVELMAKQFIQWSPDNTRFGGGAGRGKPRSGGAMMILGAMDPMASPDGMGIKADPNLAVNLQVDLTDTPVAEDTTFAIGWVFRVVHDDVAGEQALP